MCEYPQANASKTPTLAHRKLQQNLFKNNSLNKKRKKHVKMVAPKNNATSGIFVFFFLFSTHASSV